MMNQQMILRTAFAAWSRHTLRLFDRLGKKMRAPEWQGKPVGRWHKASSFNTSTAMTSCCLGSLKSRSPHCGAIRGRCRLLLDSLSQDWRTASSGTVETIRDRRRNHVSTFLDDRWWDTPTPLYRRSVCDDAGPWSDLRLEEDWEYDCRVAALGTRLVHCPEFLVEVRDHGGDRLCRGDAFDPFRMKVRARSHELIFQHAAKTRILTTDPHMQRFSRKLFLLSRQCGAAGLVRESCRLFKLAREAAGRCEVLD